MRPFQAGKIELDRCTFCRGLWFDGGELEQLLGKRPAAQLDALETSRKCAACSVPMRAAVVGGLRVEFCMTCGGVFLDDGELVALNGGQPVRVLAGEQRPARPDASVTDDVSKWLNALGA